MLYALHGEGKREGAENGINGRISFKRGQKFQFPAETCGGCSPEAKGGSVTYNTRIRSQVSRHFRRSISRSITQNTPRDTRIGYKLLWRYSIHLRRFLIGTLVGDGNSVIFDFSSFHYEIKIIDLILDDKLDQSCFPFQRTRESRDLQKHFSFAETLIKEAWWNFYKINYTNL